MKPLLFLLLFSFTSLNLSGQNDYDRGYKVGYKEGYCYNEIGCISPIPPITPIPYIGENINSYRDGYNRGFKRGLEDKEQMTNKRRATLPSNYSQMQNLNAYRYQEMANFQIQMLQQLQNLTELRRQQLEREAEAEKQKAIAMMEQTRRMYGSVKQYPKVDGGEWYKVIATNNLDFCGDRKVAVAGDKIFKYVVNDWSEREVVFSSPIKDCKAFIKLRTPDGVESEYIEIYFIDRIFQPNSTTSPPLKPGKISFYSTFKKMGKINISIEGYDVGSLNSYFDSVTPNCGQEGTLSFEMKPGTYTFKAYNDRLTWNGTFTIYEGMCSPKPLSK